MTKFNLPLYLDDRHGTGSDTNVVTVDTAGTIATKDVSADRYRFTANAVTSCTHADAGSTMTLPKALGFIEVVVSGYTDPVAIPFFKRKS